MLKEYNSLAAESAFDPARLGRYFCELSPLPMLAVEGPSFVVRHLNDAFARLAGTPRAEMIGRPFAEAVPEGEHNGCLALLDRVYRTGVAENLVEQDHRQTPAASWTYAAWAILGRDERPMGVMIQVTDATEAAAFRSQVTGMNESLLVSSVRQHELTEVEQNVNTALRLQSSALTDEHRRKDEFLAMLAHELRNPLAAISNSVQLLALEDNETPLRHSARTIIERQVGLLRRLVDDLMDAARITTGRIQLRRERLALSGVVERAVETARPLFDERQHTLSVSLPTPPPWLSADSARLEQIMVNLLTNAAKYTPHGGRVWLTVEQIDRDVAIRVRDTGVGIAPELLPRIFDLFTQGDRTLDRSLGGLGIGLAVVKRLVEAHGGRVTAHSVPEQGSEFIVRLPVAPDVAAPDDSLSTAPTPADVAAQPALRVLVVDDNLDTADSLAMWLGRAERQIRLAHNGPEALVAAIDFQPDAAVLDIGLPGMDGYELARRMRQLPGLEAIVLVAVTGYGSPADFERSRAAGFDRHLVKPVALVELAEILAGAPARTKGARSA